MRQLNLKGDEQKPDSGLRQVEEFAQDKAHDFGTVDYDLSSISERELKFAIVSGSLYAYTRRNDQIYKSPAWTAI